MAFGADANSFAGGQDINPFTGLPDTAPLSTTDLGSSQLLAFNGRRGPGGRDAVRARRAAARARCGCFRRRPVQPPGRA